MKFSEINTGLMGRVVFLACVLSLATSARVEPAGWTYPGNIDHQNFTQTVDGDIIIDGKIDGNSHVTLTSKNGSIVIHGKIDGSSVVKLTAKRNISIGIEGDGADRKIDGCSSLDAVAGGFFSLGNKIDGGGAGLLSYCEASIRIRAGTGIDIGDKIDGGVKVGLCTTTGRIHVHDRIDNSSTIVDYWPPTSLVVDNGIRSAIIKADKALAGC